MVVIKYSNLARVCKINHLFKLSFLFVVLFVLALKYFVQGVYFKAIQWTVFINNTTTYTVILLC